MATLEERLELLENKVKRINELPTSATLPSGGKIVVNAPVNGEYIDYGVDPLNIPSDFSWRYDYINLNGTNTSNDIFTRIKEALNTRTAVNITKATKYVVTYAAGYIYIREEWVHDLGVGLFGSGATQFTGGQNSPNISLVNTTKIDTEGDADDGAVVTSIADGINASALEFDTSIRRLFRRTIGGVLKTYYYYKTNPFIGGTQPDVADADFYEITPDGTTPVGSNTPETDNILHDGFLGGYTSRSNNVELADHLRGISDMFQQITNKYLGLDIDFDNAGQAYKSNITDLLESTDERVNGKAYYVVDASADPNITSGAAIYKYLGSTGVQGSVTLADDYELQIVGDLKSIEDLKNVTDSVIGDYKLTESFYSGSNIGGATYQKVDPTGLTPNNMDIIEGNDGSYWKLASSDLNVFQFGAIGDGYQDDTDNIQRAVDFGAENKLPVSLGKVHKITSTIEIPSFGVLNGIPLALLSYTQYTGTLIKFYGTGIVFETSGEYHWALEDILVDGYWGTDVTGFKVTKAHHSRIKNCLAYRCDVVGFDFDPQDNRPITFGLFEEISAGYCGTGIKIAYGTGTSYNSGCNYGVRNVMNNDIGLHYLGGNSNTISCYGGEIGGNTTLDMKFDGGLATFYGDAWMENSENSIEMNGGQLYIPGHFRVVGKIHYNGGNIFWGQSIATNQLTSQNFINSSGILSAFSFREGSAVTRIFKDALKVKNIIGNKDNNPTNARGRYGSNVEISNNLILSYDGINFGTNDWCIGILASAVDEDSKIALRIKDSSSDIFSLTMSYKNNYFNYYRLKTGEPTESGGLQMGNNILSEKATWFFIGYDATNNKMFTLNDFTGTRDEIDIDISHLDGFPLQIGVSNTYYTLNIDELLFFTEIPDINTISNINRLNSDLSSVFEAKLFEGKKKVVLDIGDWDMDTNGSKVVSHGLSSTEWKTIRDISVIIRNDSDNQIILGNSLSQITVEDEYFELSRADSSVFDNIIYSSISYNRGWITFTYDID